MAALSNALLEAVVLRYAFFARLGLRGLGLLLAANLVSVAVAMASLFVSPPSP